MWWSRGSGTGTAIATLLTPGPGLNQQLDDEPPPPAPDPGQRLRRAPNARCQFHQPPADADTTTAQAANFTPCQLGGVRMCDYRRASAAGQGQVQDTRLPGQHCPPPERRAYRFTHQIDDLSPGGPARCRGGGAGGPPFDAVDRCAEVLGALVCDGSLRGFHPHRGGGGADRGADRGHGHRSAVRGRVREVRATEIEADLRHRHAITSAATRLMVASEP